MHNISIQPSMPTNDLTYNLNKYVSDVKRCFMVNLTNLTLEL